MGMNGFSWSWVGRWPKSFSGVASARAYSAAIRPSRITYTRSHSPRISGISDEKMMIASPWRASSSQQLIDLGLGSDIDSSGRLIDEQHL